MEGLQRLQVGPRADLDRLDHPAPGPPGGLGAVRRALVAVQLQHGQPNLVGHPGDPVEGRVDEHPRQLHPAAQRRGDRHRVVQPAAARAAVVEDHPERPGAQLDRALGVGQVGGAADLDLGSGHGTPW
jgi:hypothetical protein